MEYLRERRISLAAIQYFGIGYFDIFEFDAFYDRMMFPVHDPYGNLITFQARAMFDWKAKGVGKYRHGGGNWKSHTLYGLYENGELIVKQNRVVLVEGPFDVIALWMCGIPAVATLGTAMSEEQALLIRRYTTNVILWYDPDASGQAGTATATALLKDVGCKVTTIGHRVGPDDASAIYAKGGKRYLQELLA